VRDEITLDPPTDRARGHLNAFGNLGDREESNLVVRAAATMGIVGRAHDAVSDSENKASSEENITRRRLPILTVLMRLLLMSPNIVVRPTPASSQAFATEIPSGLAPSGVQEFWLSQIFIDSFL
jgi:hypothetical protein